MELKIPALRIRDPETGKARDVPCFKPKDGYTPKKGKDYFSPDEIDEIVNKAARLVMNSGIALPEVTAADDGKILRVSGGKWVAASLHNAEEVAY